MLIALQTRLKTLIEADAYFTGVSVITEAAADIQTELDTALAKLSFAIIVSTAEGRSQDTAREGLIFQETLLISVIQSPITDPSAATRNVLDAVEHIIAAVHWKPISVTAGEPSRFRVTAHTNEPEPGLNWHKITVETLI
jgi:hypothetical protein